MLLRDVTDNEPTECENTEDLIAKFNEVNTTGVHEDAIIGSLDVKALFPSLDIDHTIEIVGQEFENSKTEIEEINFKEVVLYIALNKTQEEIDEMGLTDKCPKRKNRRGQRPKITGNGTKEKETDRYEPWIMPDLSILTEKEERKLFTIALKIALERIMKNHIYEFDGKLYRQVSGGAIGLELTGEVAKIYMSWWDRQFLGKLQELSITLILYKRYVDDINNSVRYPGDGCMIRDGNLVIDDVKAEIDKNKNRDEVTMDLLKEIGNTIHNSIQLTNDYPSKNTDERLPTLDLRVWIEEKDGKRIIMYEYYRKEVSTKTTIHARSALPLRQKKTILTQELLRIMKNCCPQLEVRERKEHINNFLMCMQFSGYGKETRYDVFNSASKAYQIALQKNESGTRPLHRPKEWERVRRKKEKVEKKKTWYKTGGNESVLFVPYTPAEKLKKAYEEEIRKSKFKIKVVEQAGTKMKDILHKKNPFSRDECGREDCMVCTTGGKGNCSKENASYTISCTEDCQEKDQYQGETGFNTYSRGVEHIEKYNNNNPKSMLLEHCNLAHDGRRVNFKMDVTGTYHRDSTKRQISEGLMIEKTPRTRLMNSKSEWNTPNMPQCVVRRLSER